MVRRIGFYKHYFEEFYVKQNQNTRDKIDYVLDLISNVEIVPKKFLKYLEGTDKLYELRVKADRKSIRIFCFFDEDRLIILTNCFVKKAQKTPKKELELATRIKNEYFEVKKK